VFFLIRKQTEVSQVRTNTLNNDDDDDDDDGDDDDKNTQIHSLYVHLARVNLHDTCTCFLVGRRKLNLAVKPTGTQQRGIQDIHTICCSNHLPTTDIIIRNEK